MFQSTQHLVRRGFGTASVIGVLFAALPAYAQLTIGTLAGNGSASFYGDGGQATAAALSNPRGLAIDSAGNILIADSNNWRIRRVAPSGIISTIAGNGAYGATGDGGPALSASMSDVMGLALDSSGNLYIADASNHRVRKMTPGGTLTTAVGTGTQGFSGDGGPAGAATLNRPTAVAFDTAGNLYIADSSNQRIRRVSPGGTISTFAGNGTPAFGGDGGQAVSAALMFPLGLAADSQGDVYIADAGNNRIRKVNPSGVITTVAGSGNGGFANDGSIASAAWLNIPSDVAVDPAGNLYIADSGNNRVRKVDTSNIITTIAGTANDGFSGDGGPAASAMLSFPWALTRDAAGAIYVADRQNNRIRKLYTGTSVPPPPTGGGGGGGTPQTVSATPGAGAGGGATFTFTFTDSGGYQNLDVVNVLINSSLDGVKACYLAYSRSSNVLYLVSDGGGTLLNGLPLSGSGVVSNSQCTVTGSGSSANGAGSNLTLTLNLTFSAAFAGNKLVYLAARDSSGGNSGWQPLGTWSVPGAAPAGPAVSGVTPARSIGSGAVTYTMMVTDTNGSQDLGVVDMLINDSLNGNKACYLAYSRTANVVYLVADGGGALLGGVPAGGTGLVSNSQCTLTAASSSSSGNTLAVTMSLDFAAAFAGNRVIYVAARSNGDTQSSGWQAVGSRTFQ